MTTFRELQIPDPQTAFTSPGDVAWRDFFNRLTNLTRELTSAASAGGATTVAGLPSPAVIQRRMVTDANTTIVLGLGSIVVGGGVNVVPVYSTGVDWRIG